MRGAPFSGEVPGRWMKACLVAVGVIAVGAPTAMLGAWVGWQSAPALPTEAQASEVASKILPEARIAEVARNPKLFYYEHEGTSDSNPVTRFLIGEDDYLAGSTEVKLASPLPPTVETEERLRSAGWVTLASGPDGIVGAKDDLLLYVLPASDVDSRPTPAVKIVRDEPVLAPVLSITGLLLGALLGTFLAGWVYRQAHLATPTARQLVKVGAVVSTVLLIPSTLSVLLTPIDVHLLAPPGDAPYPSWDLYMFAGVRGATHLGWLIQAVILVVVLLNFLRHPSAVNGRNNRPTMEATAT
ncbi:hypothetical protein ACQSSU_23560 [Micromonospora echinospora]